MITPTPAFQPFLMERMMSHFEQDVDFNLSESGVHPVTLAELIGDDAGFLDRLLATELDYPHVNGIPELRERIAALYPGAGPENVLVTVGAAEANYITTITLAGPGDTVAVMLPNYMQVWGIARNLAMQVRPFHLDESAAWSAPPAGIAAAVVPGTALVAVCNPNNPTGHALSTPEMDAIVAAADRVGAWILADEVYAGAERLGGGPSPSFFGRYDKVVATGSMSKAYGLPGLRIGWAVGPVHVIDDIWARHEYTTISASTVSNHLAAHALSPPVRERLLERTRDYIRSGYSVLEQWLAGHGGTFDVVPPDAAAIAFVRYHLDIGSADLAERLRTEQSVLVVPGSHFGMDRFLRISFGLPKGYLTTALDRMHDLIAGLSAA